MNKLKLTKFKAFEHELEISLAGKCLLLYGENGAGKSSLYEAIKVIFFKQKLETPIVAPTPEERQQLIQDFWSKYNNKINNQDFEIEINDVDYKTFDCTSYQVFMISLEELKVDNRIYLKELLNKFCFSIDDIDYLCTQGFDLLQNEVNMNLHSFNESVSIDIDEEDNYAIKVIDTRKSIESKIEIRSFFNEAKINTIILLILLSAIELSKHTTKKKILILDDFITSLDASNRTFLVKHILDKFRDTQVLVFTHNISFYNLVMFMINKINGVSHLWSFANLYEINNNHKIYQKSEIERVKNIKDDYNLLGLAIAAGDIDAIGNRIRKKFEILLYEYSKLLMIGAVEDSNKIIDRIMNGNPVYYEAGHTASDLIDKIELTLQEGNPTNLATKLQTKIDSFKNNNFANFQKIIKELKLYQKVTMHPMSHGVAGMPTFTTREIQKSIALLEKMEAFLKDMVDGNVATV